MPPPQFNIEELILSEFNLFTQLLKCCKSSGKHILSN